MEKNTQAQFTQHYQQYKDKVFSYLMYRMNFDRNICEELLMEISLKAYENYHRFDPKKGSFKTWFFRISHNHLLNHWRDKKQLQSIEAMEEKGVNLGTVEMERSSANPFDKENIDKILKLLSEKEKEVISLRYLSDLSHKEIGEITGQKEGAVRTNLSRSLKQFKQFHQKLYPQHNIQEKEVETQVTQLFTLVNKQFSSDQSVKVDAQDHIAAQYQFQAKGEGITIKKLTVMNDLEGYFDQGEFSDAVEAVQLRYKTKGGKTIITKPLPLNKQGIVEFKELKIDIPANKMTTIDILADMKDYDEFELTAQKRTYRLGLKGSPSQTEGIKAQSETGVEIRSAITESRDLPGKQVILAGLPKFKLNPLPQALKQGHQNLYSFTVTAPQETCISLARLPFDFELLTSSGGQIALSEFNFYVGKKNLNERVQFSSYQEKTGELKTNEDLYESQDHCLTVSFTEEEVIPAGESRTYTLGAKITLEDPEEEMEINIELDFDQNTQCFADQIVFGSLIGDLFANLDEYQTFKNEEDSAVAWSDRVREHYKSGHKFSLKSHKSSDDWISGFDLESENGSMEQGLRSY